MSTSKNFSNILATASISWLLFVAAPSNAGSMASCLDKGVEMHRHFAVAVTHDGNPLIDSRQVGTKRGSLWNLTHHVESAISGAILRLQQPLTHASYSMNSDQNGSFGFVEIPPGIYVLHVDAEKKPGGSDYESTDHLITLAASISRNSLKLTWREAGGGSCVGVSLEIH